MDVHQFLTKQEYLIAADHMKQEQSKDFAKGFDAGANWLRDFIVLELLNCQTSQSQKSEEE